MRLVARVASTLRDRERALTAAGLGIVGVAYGVSMSTLAVRDRLWNDELFTYYFARLPDLGDVWRQLSTGVEQTPPFFYVVTRASLALFGVNEFAIRLPALLSVLLACVCLFLFVARRSSAVYGLLSVLILLVTQAHLYAHEGRPYGLALGLSAAALLCWQLRGEREDSVLPVAGMSLSLALAVASHYYAVFVLIPLALGEAVRSVRRGRLDPLMVGGFVLALTPLLAFAPLIASARKYSDAFWTEFDWSSSIDFYGWLPLTSGISPEMSSELIGITLLVVALALHAALGPFPRITNRLLLTLAVCAVGLVSTRNVALGVTGSILLLAYWIAFRWRSERGWSNAPPVSDVVAAAGFLILPFAAVAAAELVTGAYAPRYVLPAAIGLATLPPLALHRLEGGRRVSSAVLVCLLLVLFGRVIVYEQRAVNQETQDRREMAAFLARGAGATKLPIAIGHTSDFFELSHYGPHPLSERLLHLSDPDAALSFIGTDSIEEGLVVLSRFAPLHVEPYERYVASGRPFLLLVNRTVPDWTPLRLEADGRTLHVRAQTPRLTLFEVT